MPPYLYALIILAGMADGFINVLAGNGSLITLPILIFVGLPANVANATNRVGVLMQNVVGTHGFYSKGKLDVRGALLFAIPMTLGSLLGARIAVNINEVVFKQILAIVMVIMLVLMFVDPSRWLEEKSHGSGRQLTVARFLIFFAIGIYGGFLQAGVGIFLLSALVHGIGYNIVPANAVKVAMVLVSALVSLLVFQLNSQVD
jgi:uncharacterized membrane protein YfcA